MNACWTPGETLEPPATWLEELMAYAALKLPPQGKRIAKSLKNKDLWQSPEKALASADFVL